MNFEKRVFLGFVVANADEEYFGGCKDNGFALMKAWVRLPELAQRFESAGKASKAIQKAKFSYPVWILRLFETENHFFVESYGGSAPPWLVHH